MARGVNLVKPTLPLALPGSHVSVNWAVNSTGKQRTEARYPAMTRNFPGDFSAMLAAIVQSNSLLAHEYHNDVLGRNPRNSTLGLNGSISQ